MDGHYTVTISPQPQHRGGGYRVRLGFYPADWNALSRQILESHIARREKAERTARQWAAEYGADILGLEG